MKNNRQHRPPNVWTAVRNQTEVVEEGPEPQIEIVPEQSTVKDASPTNTRYKETNEEDDVSITQEAAELELEKKDSVHTPELTENKASQLTNS